MKQKPTLTVLVGLPGSGKTTYAKENADENTVHLSSDEIRDSLFLGIQSREVNNKVFSFMQKVTNSSLKSGSNVVYDATNISYKDRRSVLNSVPKDVYKKSVLFVVPFEVCLDRNDERNCPVPDSAMIKMYKRFNVPLTSEGFDSCEIRYHQDDDINLHYDLMQGGGFHDSRHLTRRFSGNLIECMKGGFAHLPYSRLSTHEELEQFIFSGLSNFAPEAESVFNLPHDNPNHTYSVSKHIYHVWRQITLWKEDELFRTNGSTQVDWESLSAAALFHDIGKGFTKQFKDGKGNDTDIAHYYGHENVSSYVSLVTTMRLNSIFEEQVFNPLKIAELVQFHMKLYPYASKEKQWKKLVSPDVLSMLGILNEADKLAK